MKDKIIFMALLLAALLPGILAASVPSAHAAPAQAKISCSTQVGAWIIATANGNNLRVGGNTAAGNPVIQKANNIGNGVVTCWHQTGTKNGNMVGYWEADNGNRFGAGPNCTTGVNWLNVTDGTLWIWISKSGGFSLQNVKCDGRLSSDNTAGDQWTRRPDGANGYYQLLNLHAPGT